MKSLGLVTLVVLAFTCCFSFAETALALDVHTNLIAQAPVGETQPAATTSPTEVSDPVTESAAPADKPHVATPAGDPEVTKFAGFRQFLEDQQNAHDKLIVDRFLLGVAVIFAVIAAALLFSLPPKPREQKE